MTPRNDRDGGWSYARVHGRLTEPRGSLGAWGDRPTRTDYASDPPGLTATDYGQDPNER